MRLIDADVLLGQMQPDSKFEINSYADAAAMAIANAYIKLVENQPTVEAPDINVGSMDITTHDSIPAETSENDEDRTSGDCISRQQAIYEIHEDADWLASQGSDWQAERMERDKSILKSLPSIQPEQQWIPVTEIPPRGRDLMLKVHDRRCSLDTFNYYVMGFYDGEKYFTYNFSWWEDKDLEIVGWQLCPWEEGEQE